MSCVFTSLISSSKQNSYVTSASDSRVNYFSYEECTVCISIKNQHEEGMAELNGWRKRHWHDFNSSCCCCLSTFLINIQRSLVDNLGKKKTVTLGSQQPLEKWIRVLLKQPCFEGSTGKCVEAEELCCCSHGCSSENYYGAMEIS